MQSTIIYNTQDSKQFRIPGSVGALVSSSTSSPPGAGASGTITTSTVTTMRPPPPPGPPKPKENKPEKGHEEPSSSIPDLGEFLFYRLPLEFYLEFDRLSFCASKNNTKQQLTSSFGNRC